MREKEQNYEKRKALYRSLQVESFNVLKSMNYELYHLQANANETNSNFSMSQNSSSTTTEISKEQEEQISKLKNEIQNLQKELEMGSKPNKESKEMEEILKEMKEYDEKTQKEIEMNNCLLQEIEKKNEQLEFELNTVGNDMVSIQTDAAELNSELAQIRCLKCNQTLNVS
jgi:septal ring factor EnvC (AmiA/AmiB activator)